MTKKRYNLVINEDLFNQIKSVADTHGVTMLAVIQQYIQLGLTVDKMMQEGGDLVVRYNDHEHVLLLIW